MAPEELPQARAIKRRFFPKKRLALAVTESLVQLFGSVDIFKPAQTAAEN